MIDPANEILRDLIQSRIPALAGPTQVGFEPPNEDWRLAVGAAGEERLNLYLQEVQENRKLRTNERRVKGQQEGWISDEPAPARLDCRYLITAWSPVTFLPPTAEPTRFEHQRLSDVARVLFRYRALVPAEVYSVPIPDGHDITSVDARLRDEELPLEVAVADGPSVLGEFWSTMKVGWRPSIHVTLTVPIFLDEDEREFPMVTTLVADHLPAGKPEAVERLLVLGGHVTAGAAATPVKGAWVQLLGLAPPAIQTVRRHLVTLAGGRFVFARVPAGHYQLRAVATALGELQREVDLPSETGEYDLRFP